MVLACFVKPIGKERVSQVLTELGITGFSGRTLLRSLARCAAHNWRGGVQATLYSCLIIHGDLSLMFFDMSMLYFGMDKEGDLAYSKGRRVGPRAGVGILSHANLTALVEVRLSRVVSSKTSKAPYDLPEHTHFHARCLHRRQGRRDHHS